MAEKSAALEEAQRDGKMLPEEVDADQIAAIVAKWTGIPVSRMLESESEKLIHMEERLKSRVVGQDEALRLVANAVRRARSGLSDPNRPIGSFIFLGPTGVGKTETARALAEFLFDDDQAIVRIDMSEYQEKHTVARLIGAPPGYVGYEEGGQLTEAVRRRPYSIVLFDEIEKAHPEVFNVLLQLLDDGRLTDGQGRTVDFRNTVIIMTSNLGSHWIQQYGATDYAKMKAKVLETLKESFKPEFLNRIDEIVIYHTLPLDQIKKIVEIQITLLQKRLEEMQIILEVSDKARPCERTRLICVSHVSNVLGSVNPVKEIAAIAGSAGALLLVDGTQSAPHMRIDVRGLGCDFFVFSGHKMLGPAGTGVLYGRKDILETMEPLMTGGGMVDRVSIDKVTWSGLPWRFEAGTPDAAGAVALAGATDRDSGEKLIGALDYLEGIGMEEVRSHGVELAAHTLERMRERDDIIIYGPESPESRCGIISFNVVKHGSLADPAMIAWFLDQEGIAVRAGAHCAQPLMARLGVEGTLRASFYVYNTLEEAERFMETLKEIIDRKIL